MKALSICAIVLAAMPLSAGVRLQAESVDLKTNKVTPQEFLLESTRFRANDGEGNSSMFLTNGGNRLIILNKQKNEYTEMNQQTIEQMAGQMNDAMSKMQEQMSKMPPQQREMMEKMMKGRMPQGQAELPKTTFVKKGSATVNGFPCTKYDGMEEGEKVLEVCTTPFSNIKVSGSDAQIVDKLKAFMADFQKALSKMPVFGNIASSVASEWQFEGYPVERIQFEDGKPVHRYALKSATSASFSDADFSLGNAVKKEMPMLGPRGGKR